MCRMLAPCARMRRANALGSASASCGASSMNIPLNSGTNISNRDISKATEPTATMPLPQRTTSLLKGLLAGAVMFTIPLWDNSTPLGCPVVPEV